MFRGFYHREPTSWQDYQIGLRHIWREREREKLRIAVALRMAQAADAKDFKSWVDVVNRVVDA